MQYYKLLNTTQHFLGSKTIAATSGVPDEDFEDLEKELEDLMMDDNIPGIFDIINQQDLSQRFSTSAHI